MVRWLVTGATGLLGSNAALQFATNSEVVGLARRVPFSAPVPFLEGDLSSAGSRAGLVGKSRATAVLHAAAIASIEECARDPEQAWELNVAASADLARQAAAVGAAFVYVSTDAVFDGTAGPYTEQDEPSPGSVYGRSKLAGEQAVLEANPDALVARVNFFGWSPSGHRSLAEFFHSRLARNESVTGFTDTIVSTMYVGDLVRVIGGLVEAGTNGVVNVASSEPTSKFDFGRRLASAFGFDPELVRPGLSSDLLSVKRGANLGLRTGRAEAIVGYSMPNQDDGIRSLVQDYKAGRPSAVNSFNPQESSVT